MRYIIAIAAILVVLLMAGCGGASQSSTSQATSSEAVTIHNTSRGPFAGLHFKRAQVNYVACMHAHGVKDVPGPGVPGAELKALADRSPAYRAANLACYRTLVSANRATSSSQSAPTP
jgi:hypothetical protein